MPTIDELAARSAASLRDRVADGLDVDAGLRSALAEPMAPRRSPRAAVWAVSAAAAVVLLVAGALLVLDDDQGVVTPATSPTTGVPVTTVAPSPTGSTVVVTTSTVAITEPTVVPPAQDGLLTVDVASPRLEPAPDFPCSASPCQLPLISSDGTYVGFDGASSLFVTEPNGTSRSIPLVLGDALDLSTSQVVAVGPQADVAYLTIAPLNAQDPVGQLVAVSLAGSNAGYAVVTATGVDMSGDSTILATPDGLVQVGDLGPEQRPEPGAAVIIPWVDNRSGATVPPFGRFTRFDPNTDTITRYDASGTFGEWTIPSGVDLSRGVPEVAEIGDGAIGVMGWDWMNSQWVLLRLPQGGVAQRITLPDGYSPAGFWSGTAVLFDGTSFWQWNLPGYTEPADLTQTWSGRLGTTQFASLDDAIEQVTTDLTGDDSCDVAPTATVVERRDDPPALFAVEHRFGCDDANEGQLLTFVFDLDGDLWQLTAVTQRTLCSRGISENVCV